MQDTLRVQISDKMQYLDINRPTDITFYIHGNKQAMYSIFEYSTTWSKQIKKASQNDPKYWYVNKLRHDELVINKLTAQTSKRDEQNYNAWYITNSN